MNAAGSLPDDSPAFVASRLEMWRGTTWRECFRNARNRERFSDEQKRGLWRTLAGLRRERDFEAVCDGPVTGAISQGWTELDEEGPLFQACLERVAQEFPGDWTPAEYLLDYYGACLEWPLALCDMDLGRALRSLPSFLREIHLAGMLRARGREVRIPAARENAELHVDFVLRLGRRDIAVWNYLDTPRSRAMLARKIRSRGEIAEGLNLLAPIRTDRDTAALHGWELSGAGYVAALEAAARGKPERFGILRAGLADPESLGRFRLFRYPDRPGFFRRLLGI